MNEKTKRLVTMAMLAALAYLVMVAFRIPVVLFLKYEPKDVVLTIGSLILGAPAGLLMSAVVALVEMVTVSETGIIGAAMNILASCTFLLPVTLLYRRRRSISSAVLGLGVSILLTTGAMLLWNYAITPLYMDVPREVVTGMLIPYFLPFNLVKCGLNAGIILLLYKPVVMGLQRARLLPASHAREGRRTVILLALGLVLVCVFALLILVMKGII